MIFPFALLTGWTNEFLIEAIVCGPSAHLKVAAYAPNLEKLLGRSLGILHSANTCVTFSAAERSFALFLLSFLECSVKYTYAIRSRAV